MITLYDPRIGYPIELFNINIFEIFVNSFIFFNFEVREILDVHETKTGIQIELFG